MKSNVLVKYEAAKKALEIAKSVDEVKDIRDKAQAIAAYARQANDTAMVEWATEIKVRAERRAGEMLKVMEKNEGGRPSKNQSHVTTGLSTKLDDLGISRDNSSRWQKLAAIPESQFEEAVEAAKEVAGEVTTSFMLNINKPHVSNNSGENEWYTPSNFIESARKVMGTIDLDPASSIIANSIVKAKKFFSIEDDGLQQKWAGNVWMNPPYSQPEIKQFAFAISEKYKNGEIDQACVLVNNATETEWFQTVLKESGCACFVSGRIKFLDRKLEPSGAPLQGQAIIYLGNKVDEFVEEFQSYGIVLRK